MALLWKDGFDRWGASGSNVDLAYFRLLGSASFSAVNTSSTGGVNGGGSYTLTSEATLQRTVNQALTAGGMVHAAFWFKPSVLTDRVIYQWQTNLQGLSINLGNNNGPQIRMNSDGSLRGNQHGSTLTATGASTPSPGALTTNVYAFIEYAAKWNTFANGGFIKIWVNGNLVYDTTLSSFDCVSGTVPTTMVSTGGYCRNAIGEAHTFDDSLIWDETGTDFAHTQLSSLYIPIIETVNVNGDDWVEFTRLSGSTNWEMVDDPAFHDGNSSYNSTVTPGRIDQLHVASLATSPAAIFAVAMKTTAAISIAGTVNLRTRHNSGEAIVESANRLLSTTFAHHADFYGKDWNGAVDWTEASFNALKVGYKFHSTPATIMTPEPTDLVLSASVPIVTLTEYIIPSAQLTLTTSAPIVIGEAMVLLQEVVTSGSQASVSFSAIPATYRDLEIRVRGRSDAAAVNERAIALQFNGDTASNYHYNNTHILNATAGALNDNDHTAIFCCRVPGATATASHPAGAVITIYDYRGTTFFKVVRGSGGNSRTTAVADQNVQMGHGMWESLVAITDILVFLESGNWVDGSVISLYGIK